jgi:hypothetical protein
MEGVSAMGEEVRNGALGARAVARAGSNMRGDKNTLHSGIACSEPPDNQDSICGAVRVAEQCMRVGAHGAVYVAR